MSAKISIIVPIYKVEPYLRQCVGSILAQSYTNFELILVDDGSPDKCGEICDEYAKKDNRIKVIHKKNGGLSSARNAGLDIAAGDFIGFIDGDDFVDTDMYEILYNLLVEYNADVAECSLKIIKSSNLQPLETDKIKDGTVESGDNLFALKRLLEKPIRNVACNKLYKKELFADLRYPDKLYEDGFLTYKIFYKLKKYVFIELDKYNYVQREDSIMGKQKKYSLKNLDGLEVQEERYQFLKSRIKNQTILILAEYNLFRQILFHYKMMQQDSKQIDPDRKFRKMLKNRIIKEYTRYLSNYRLSEYKNLIRFSKYDIALFDYLFSHYNLYLKYLEIMGILKYQIKKVSRITKKFSI
ncbi:glycosyltransferase family 2 protein [Neobacillus terrae]|uniref:glycosyltransferase family 2 protein n=1 Tax=Neobacillus terrae TaxID=3034837 RepID=UPI00140D5ABA|nr:glycosyltransferase [Neobacillus terrae]NHM29280.1 glycosyltransferase [Neobacillus terrae]